MKILRILAVTGLVAMAGAACADLEVTNLNDPDRERALATPGDVRVPTRRNPKAIAPSFPPACRRIRRSDSKVSFTNR